MTRRFLFSCMRNEAAYALEWIAYHRLIGFDHIVICTNDCDDNTPDLLDALAAIGWVTHIPNPTPEGVAPQLHASSRIGERTPWIDGDWVMWLDTDEYLNIHLGTGHLDDLIPKVQGSDGYAVHWRLFGEGTQSGWSDAPVIQRFYRTGAPGEQLHQPVKTLFRWSPSIDALHTHRPTLRPSFRETGRHWSHGTGEPVPEQFYYTRLYRDASPALRLPLIASQYAWAQVNHYAVRSRVEYMLKAKRGSGLYDKRHTEEYWKLYNLNDAEDRSIQRHVSEVEMQMAEAFMSPAVHLEHTRAVERMASLTGNAEGDERR
ncbi:MAG: glycosyltransferase family 2 protein [Pseudomonadota bacterium]